MKGRGLAVILVLVGLGLGATLLRDQVPLGTAQQTAPATADSVAAERGARLQNEQNTIDVVGRYEPGLVFISTENEVMTQDPFGMMFGGGQTQVQQGVGSGFFVNKAGDILTNYHVVAGQAGSGAADRITVRLMGREQSVPARVIGLAPQYDLALIRPQGLAADLIRPIPLGDSDGLKVGQKAIAMSATTFVPRFQIRLTICMRSSTTTLRESLIVSPFPYRTFKEEDKHVIILIAQRKTDVDTRSFQVSTLPGPLEENNWTVGRQSKCYAQCTRSHSRI